MRSARARAFGRTLQWGVAAAAAAMAALGAGAGPAAADATYHTERLEFAAVGGAPLRGGAVVNAHANGPQVFAREQYTLVGAQPATDYQVLLLVYTASSSCTTGTPLMLPTAVLTTNAAGNGTGAAVFTPADAAGLRGLTVGGRWQLTLAGVPGAPVLYETPCTAITLD